MRRRDREKEEEKKEERHIPYTFWKSISKILHATTKKMNDKQSKFCPNSQPTLPAALA